MGDSPSWEGRDSPSFSPQCAVPRQAIDCTRAAQCRATARLDTCSETPPPSPPPVDVVCSRSVPECEKIDTREEARSPRSLGRERLHQELETRPRTRPTRQRQKAEGGEALAKTVVGPQSVLCGHLCRGRSYFDHRSWTTGTGLFRSSSCPHTVNGGSVVILA